MDSIVACMMSNCQSDLLSILFIHLAVLDILMSIPSIPYARFHQDNFKRDSLNSFLPKFFRYFCTLLISNCKFEITTVNQIDLYDNLIVFIFR